MSGARGRGSASAGSPGAGGAGGGRQQQQQQQLTGPGPDLGPALRRGTASRSRCRPRSLALPRAAGPLPELHVPAGPRRPRGAVPGCGAERNGE